MPSRTRKPKKTAKTRLLQPLAEGADKDLNSHVFYAALFLILGLRWWLGAGIGMFWNAERADVTGAFHSAWQILDGQWLGPFHGHTLFTEPLLALLFAGLAAIDLPVHSALALCTVAAGLYFAVALRRSGAHRWTALIGVAFALFHPTALSATWQELGPETFWTISGWLALSGLLASFAEIKSGRSPGLHALAFAIFGAAFLHWGGTSGFWAATLVTLLLAFLWGAPFTNWPITRRLPMALVLLLLPIGTTAAFRVGTRLLNSRHYGVRLVSLPLEGEFVEFKRTLARVTASEKQMVRALPKWTWLPEVWGAPQVELKEGQAERLATRIGLTAYARGAYRTAPDGEAFYRRLRLDLERACDSDLSCAPKGLDLGGVLRNAKSRVQAKFRRRPNQDAVARELAQLRWVPLHWAPTRGPLSELPSVQRAPAPLDEHQTAAAVREFVLHRLFRDMSWLLGLTLVFVGFRAVRRAIRQKFGAWSFLESVYVGVGVFGGIDTLVWLIRATPNEVHRGIHLWMLASIGAVVLSEFLLVSIRRRLDKLERDSRFSVDNPNYLRPVARTQRR